MVTYMVIGTNANDEQVFFSGKVYSSRFLAIAEMACIAANKERDYNVDLQIDKGVMLITEMNSNEELVSVYKIYDFEM